MAGQLVHTDTGTVLWTGEFLLERSSSEGQSDPIAMLVVAVISQIISNFVDPTRNVARLNNTQLFLNEFDGLLVGRRNPLYDAD